MTTSDSDEKLNHPCFPQPMDPTISVWRYMDLAKFIWLLDRRMLYLSRLDLLGDPHEGSTPRFLAEIRDKQIRELIDKKELKPVDLGEINRRVRNSLYVNCWQAGETESEAMWRLYCPEGNGVAIQTTYERLVDSVSSDPNMHIGCISYINYERTGFPFDNLLYPAMHKRMSFAHENEVRLVKHVGEFLNPDKPSPDGYMVDWPLEDTVSKIFVNPYASGHYHDVVMSVVRKFCPALEDKVQWSYMRADPVY